MSVEDTLNERHNQHGDFRKHAFYTDEMKRVLRLGLNWEKLSPSQRESLDMIAHKIGRILAGDPDHSDHWHDIAGYATLVDKQLTIDKTWVTPPQ